MDTTIYLYGTSSISGGKTCRFPTPHQALYISKVLLSFALPLLLSSMQIWVMSQAASPFSMAKMLSFLLSLKIYGWDKGFKFGSTWTFWIWIWDDMRYISDISSWDCGAPALCFLRWRAIPSSSLSCWCNLDRRMIWEMFFLRYLGSSESSGEFTLVEWVQRIDDQQTRCVW